MSNVIILIDDEQAVLELQKEALSQIGLTAELFLSPVAALRRIENGDVALETEPGKTVRFPHAQVQKANLKFEW